jgi:hypothetical protein
MSHSKAVLALFGAMVIVTAMMTGGAGATSPTIDTSTTDGTTTTSEVTDGANFDNVSGTDSTEEYIMQLNISSGEDVDLFVGEHRKSLHYPVLGWVPALVAVAGASLAPSALAVGVAVGAVAFALHASSDVLGAGEELRPWERTNPDAVYCHACGRWLRARYVVRYDGAPEDLLLTVGLSLPAAVTFDGWLRALVVAVVLLAAVYTFIRKRVPEWLGV